MDKIQILYPGPGTGLEGWVLGSGSCLEDWVLVINTVSCFLGFSSGHSHKVLNPVTPLYIRFVNTILQVIATVNSAGVKSIGDVLILIITSDQRMKTHSYHSLSFWELWKHRCIDCNQHETLVNYSKSLHLQISFKTNAEEGSKRPPRATHSCFAKMLNKPINEYGFLYRWKDINEILQYIICKKNVSSDYWPRM